jgi:hypothetical protein
MTRFNKQNMLNHLWFQIENLEKVWGFDPDNGWSQVANADMHKIMAYGEYEGYKQVIDSINYNSL